MGKIIPDELLVKIILARIKIYEKLNDDSLFNQHTNKNKEKEYK